MPHPLLKKAMQILPARVPILYVILGVLLIVSVVPMYFYADRVVSINRERLKTNEMLLQNTVTRAVSDDLAQRNLTLRMMLANLGSAVKVSTGGNISGEHVSTPELRALLEQFVSSEGDVVYATILNSEARGISAGKIQPDSFIQREFERAFAASRESRPYTGQPLTLSDGKKSHTVVVMSLPLVDSDRYVGMIGTVIDLQFLVDHLDQISKAGLNTYVIDHEGRLVAGAIANFVTGQDMRTFAIAKKFADQPNARFTETTEFEYRDGAVHQMLGTYSPVPSLEWAVIAQKDQREAYASVYEMQSISRLLAVLAILLSIFVSFLAARRITGPLNILTASSRAIAKGDFSKRVELKSRTEFGELANTFNIMSEELEQFVEDLKRAAEENRSLFMNSIQMIAGAVDEKDPYTRGHSDRVTKYSVLLATELGLSEAEVDKIRIAAQLHDVGKIGIEDAVLKKPGALTPEEYEIMKTHTSKGANILRPVEHLKDMLPGIELHHESLDGRGYPYGLKGDQIPLMARIITVADTFDAMTTNRPYQAAMETEYVVKRIRSMAGTKFDPRVVASLETLFQAGKIRPRRTVPLQPENQVAPVAVAAAAAANVGDLRERI
jgi:putative nucleotidyltransferase with HDIG domain